MFLVAAVVLPFLALLAFQARNESRGEQERIEHETIAHARLVAARVDDHVSNVESLLLVLSHTLSIDPADSAKNEALLVEVKSKLPPFFNNLKINAVDGSPLGSSSGMKMSVTDRKYAQDAIASKRLGFGEPVTSRSTGEWTVGIGRAVLDAAGNVTAVVSVSTRLNRLNDLLDPTGTLADGATITLLDENGLVLSHTPDPNAWIGKAFDADGASFFEGTDLEGVGRRSDENGVRIVAFAACAKAPWRVVVGTSSATFLDRNHFWRSGGLAAIAACAAFALAALLANGISRPVREGEARFRSLHRNITDAIHWIEVGADGAFVMRDPNPAFETLTGRGAAEIVGRSPQEVLPPPLAQALVSYGRKCVEQGSVEQFEERYAFPAGTRQIVVQLVPAEGPDGRFNRIAAFMKDVTETRKNETALLHSQKLESLGVLAGGVAHDFNNLLTAMQGNVSLARLGLPADSPAGAPLTALEKIIHRSAALARQMLAYAGKGRSEVRPTDINLLVEEMAGLLTVSISRKVDVRLELAPGLRPVLADAIQLQQLVMNLITNASEAIGDAPGVIRLATRAEGGVLVLEVSDTGAGMERAIQGRIFDPFFTTKTGGSGLGLSAVQGILSAHAAHIDVESEVGKGTTFRIRFPVSPT